MKIALCDDDLLWLSQEEELIRNYMKMQDKEIQLDTFRNSKELLDKIAKNPYDVVFMDIELDEENGIKIIQQLNSLSPNCQVVYVSYHLHYALDVYQTEHTYFVTKDELENRLEDIMNKVFKNQIAQESKIGFNLGKRKQRFVSEDEILYFERNLRMTKVYLKEETFEIPESLQSLVERLPADRFMRCHNSFLVHIVPVEELHRNYLTLKDGTTIPVSRSHSSHVRETFARWSLLQ